jgi:hypothetical protein
MSAYLKYNQLKSLQILIPNQLIVDNIFTFYLLNLLNVNIFVWAFEKGGNLFSPLFFRLKSLLNHNRN